MRYEHFRHVVLATCLLNMAVVLSHGQIETFEKVEIPISRNDFISVLNLYKTANNITNQDLLKKDSILFYRNGRFEYKFYCSDLKRFENNTHDFDKSIANNTDSIFNKKRNCFDYYFKEESGNKFLSHRKYFNTSKQVFKEEEFSDGAVCSTAKRKFNSSKKMVKYIYELPTDSTFSEVEYTWKGNYMTAKKTLIKKPSLTTNYTLSFDDRGLLVSGIDSIRSKNGLEISNFQITRNNDLAEKINALKDGIFFAYLFFYEDNKIILKSIVDNKENENFILVIY
jgi:hypothetical protein